MGDPSATPPPLRVLHFPTDVGGHPSGLAAAERALGAESTVAVIGRSPRDYPVDVDLGLAAAGRWRRLAGRARYLLEARREHDVFHFNFGQSFLPRLGRHGLDLPFLRRAGKRLFMTFQGCDARQTGYCRAHYEYSCCGDEQGPGLCRAEDDAGKQRAIAYGARHCHRLFCLPPEVLHHVPGSEFVPYASVDPARITPAQEPRRPGPLRIVHAPTHRLIKGTDHVLRAIDAVRDRHEVELALVEDVPHEEALRRYRDADLVIDQLKTGWYGGFAVEVMAMGKPVVSYVREEGLRRVPAAMARELPVIRADPGSIVAVLDELLADPARLREVGRRSRRYVERWHDPRRIAKRMLEIYADPDRPFWDASGVLPEV